MIQTQPFFSIIIPVYNAEKYIVRAVNSVLKQTYKNFELILVDDGSIDASGKYSKDYISKYDNIRYFYQENAGASAARNKGIEASVGQYIIFMDADDMIDDVLLETVYKALKRDKFDSDILFFGKAEVTAKGDIVSIKKPSNRRIGYMDTSFFKELLVRNLLPTTWNKAIKSSFIGETRFKKIRIGEDYQFYLDLLKKNPKVSAIPNILYKYFVESESSVYKSFDKDRVEVLTQQSKIIHYLAEMYSRNDWEVESIDSYHNAFAVNQVITNFYRPDCNLSSSEKYVDIKKFVSNHSYNFKNEKKYFTSNIQTKLLLTSNINKFKFFLLNILYKLKG
ncbi:glycosyltransferase family 2 protein [Latilactobacillus sakei]|uniref:glycosyltransferase family 2 protein n=1 Tax=Latilactobacillus sakei TaxID=1599 RepID=UPI003883891A